MTSGRAASVAGDSLRARWPFVGRDAEVDGVIAALNDLDSLGVVIHGAPGVGKSRLAEEILDVAEAGGWWCVRAVASERTRQVPLGAVAHLLPARILLDRSDPLTLFPKVAETVKRRGKGRRVVLLIDDLQLLDFTTATLVGQLLDARLNFLVGTVRTGEPVPQNVAGIWRDGRVARVDLGELTRRQLEALLQVALGARSLPTLSTRSGRPPRATCCTPESSCSPPSTADSCARTAACGALLVALSRAHV
jgi:hypothetical protein